MGPAHPKDAMDFDNSEPTRTGLIIQFSLEAKPDKAETAKAGRPVMKDVEYIKIMVPGNSNGIVHVPVTDKHRREFANQYENWKRNAENPIQGQPLREWPPLRPSEVAHLVHNNVRTVEELAAVSDTNIQTLGPGYLTLRQKARDFLEAAKNTGFLTELREQTDLLRSQNEALQRQLDAANAELRTLKPPEGAEAAEHGKKHRR